VISDHRQLETPSARAAFTQFKAMSGPLGGSLKSIPLADIDANADGKPPIRQWLHLLFASGLIRFRYW
jgi:hypothetical protein